MHFSKCYKTSLLLVDSFSTYLTYVVVVYLNTKVNVFFFTIILSPILATHFSLLLLYRWIKSSLSPFEPVSRCLSVSAMAGSIGVVPVSIGPLPLFVSDLALADDRTFCADPTSPRAETHRIRSDFMLWAIFERLLSNSRNPIYWIRKAFTY